MCGIIKWLTGVYERALLMTVVENILKLALIIGETIQ